MSVSSICIWTILCLIGVSDAREHRIPNKFVLGLLAVGVLEVLQLPAKEWFTVFSDKATSLVFCFILALLLYVIKVIAAGDVKLIAVLGFILGLGSIQDFLFYTCVSTAFIGSMYWALHKLVCGLSTLGIKARNNSFDMLNLSVAAYGGGERVKQAVLTQQGLTYMPFAPVLIIGLAMHQYFSY